VRRQGCALHPFLHRHHIEAYDMVGLSMMSAGRRYPLGSVMAVSAPLKLAPSTQEMASHKRSSMCSSRERQSMKIILYHNILWAKYKGAIFSRLFSLCRQAGIDATFVQIAETNPGYADLGGVDLSYHNYPFRLLASGSYVKVPLIRRIWLIGKDLLSHGSDLVVLPGYSLVEFWMMLAVCVLLRRKRAVFCDATALDGSRTRFKEFAKRIFFSRCDGVFCYGARSVEYISSYGVPSTRIYSQCQAAALPHEYDPDVVQAAYGAQANGAFMAPHFIFIGRLSMEKGLFDLLEAFSLVRARLAGARLNLVGAGPLEDTLKQSITRLELDGAVTLLGPQDLDEVVPLLYRSVALVLPSHSEPWGLVVNESLSYGCPVVVSSQCGCVPELVIEGVTGYSFMTGSVEALSAAMIAVVDLSTDRATTAKNCLKVMSAFSPANAASRILKGCKEIIQRRG
jgi:glycosyltransferase involved in cell wall biosynthesis